MCKTKTMDIVEIKCCIRDHSKFSVHSGYDWIHIDICISLTESTCHQLVMYTVSTVCGGVIS